MGRGAIIVIVVSVFAVLFAMLYLTSGTTLNEGVTNDTNSTNDALENAIRIAEGLNETKDFKRQFKNLNITREAFYTNDERAQFTLRWLDQSGLPKDKPIIAVVYAVRTDVENSTFLGVFIDPETNVVYHTDQAATPFG